MISARTTPLRLDLKKDKQLDIEWQDGTRCTYSLTLLRTMCPCAACKDQRAAEKLRKPTSLNILPGNFTSTITVVDAQLVGNYALRIDWSDGHATGIYSFEYLREICPEKQS